MAKSAESPHTTRRRVWRFVFGCLFVVLVVGLWPLKAYRIDQERFVDSLRPALPGVRITLLEPEAGDTQFSFFDFYTPRQVNGYVRESNSIAGDTFVWKEFPGYGGKVYAFTARTDLDPINGVIAAADVKANPTYCFLEGNIIGFVTFSTEASSPGKTQEQTARDCFDAIFDGIEREIPGITTFYNPPARQIMTDLVLPFYYDRVRPFL